MPRILPTLSAALALAAAWAGAASAEIPGEPVRTIETSAGPMVLETLADGLEHPWGMAFLPDGRLLVTERPGRLRILDEGGRLSDPLAGVPEVYARGQGGLLDVALDPEFAETGYVYLAFSEPGREGGSTAVGRGRLAGDRIEGFAVLFAQDRKIDNRYHFGGRIAFDPDGRLFLTTGERFLFSPAQDLSDHLGTTVRIERDGDIPQDNPFVGRDDARDAIWSYGHRNIEGAAVHPETGALWIVEMGPRGGDELNRIEPGGNYGWPEVSWGEHYDGRDIPDPPTRPEFIDAVTYWVPSISPSGLTFYTGELIPDWRGDALIGGLSGRALVRVALDGGEAVEQERLDMDARIRDVVVGPDGAVHLLTDRSDGEIWRLSPAD
jgi:glucose/arabinose dehydrogenase